LIVDLSNALGCTGRRDFCREVFHDRSWYRGEEINVCIRVEISLEVRSDDMQVFRRGLDEIDGRDIWDLVPLRFDMTWERVSHRAQRRLLRALPLTDVW
jgi:hypothetical protein